MQAGDDDRENPLAGVVGRSPQAQALRSAIASAAATASTVLLTGETGTGKGLAARLLHAVSPRRRAPFVHVDCATLSPGLIESELFGHERGAFTGAIQRRRGRLELAGSGTLFLDEIGDLPPPFQAKLLRVLQEREYERIGGVKTLHMGARVLAATNRDLADEVRRRRFRVDLYFRLKVIHIRVASLRTRAQDVPLLVQDAIRRLAPRLGRQPPAITAGCWSRLVRYPWPGNVRELGNVVERLLVAGVDPWHSRHLSEMLELEAPSRAGAPGERERITTALEKAGGNVAQAARRLELPRSTLRYRIGKYGLDPRREVEPASCARDDWDWLT